MASVVLLKHKEFGLVVKGFYGFSWTYLFFGFLVPLVRGEVGRAFLHLVFGVFTCGISSFVMAFTYNKEYTKRLIERGYVFADKSHVVAEAKRKLM